jgi:NADH-quinone oxidoreductase subunit A
LWHGISTSTPRSGFFLPYFVKKVTKSAPGAVPRRREERVRPVEPFDLSAYYPIFLYLLAVVGFAAVTLVAAHKIGPRKDTPIKLMPYESGMDPIGDARRRFDVKFYLIAIMFLVFDVELLFLYPWGVIAYNDALGLPPGLADAIFWSVLVFLAVLVLAYVYDWRKGVFRWR